MNLLNNPYIPLLPSQEELIYEEINKAHPEFTKNQMLHLVEVPCSGASYDIIAERAKTLITENCLKLEMPYSSLNVSQSRTDREIYRCRQGKCMKRAQILVVSKALVKNLSAEINNTMIQYMCVHIAYNREDHEDDDELLVGYERLQEFGKYHKKHFVARNRLLASKAKKTNKVKDENG
jgi:hypothetical protein